MDNLKINQLSYIYSYIASSYDAGKKLFDEFVPLIEYYFVEKSSLKHSYSVNNLTIELNEFYGICIPQATLLKLLHTMQKQGKVKVTNGTITLLRENLNQDYVLKRGELESDLDELYADFVEYLRENGKTKTKEECKNLLNQLVLNYSYVFAEYYGIGRDINNLELEDSELISDYFNKHLKNQDKLNQTFASLLVGAQKTALLNLRPAQLKIFEESDLSIQNIILDSNFALRLLRLQDPLNNDVANDTFCVLRDKGVKIGILSITVKEMAQAISRYLQESDPIVPGTREILGKGKLRFSGFYCAEQNGMPRSELVTLTSFRTLSKQLEDKGVQIIYREDYKFNKDLIDGLKTWKNRNSYSTENAMHDLRLIYYCEKCVRQSQGKIRILTNDARLTSWNAKRNSLDNVCITEMQLSSLLWLRGISKDLVLDNMVAALSDIHSWGSDEVLKFQQSFARHVAKADITAENIDALVDRLISAPEGLLDDFDNENYELMNEVALAKLEQVHLEIEEGKKFARKVQELEFDRELKEKQEREKRYKLNQKIEESQNKTNSNIDRIKNINKELIILQKTNCKSVIWLVFAIIVMLLIAVSFGCLIYFLNDYSLLGIIISAIGMGGPFLVALISILISGKAMGLKEVFAQFLFVQIKRYLKKYGYHGNISDFKTLRQTIRYKKKEKDILMEENESNKSEIEKCEYALSILCSVDETYE